MSIHPSGLFTGVDIEQLEEALEAYTGALLLVTHDRRLLENVRLSAHWEVAEGQLTAHF